MIDTDSLRYIIEYCISVIFTFLLFGMGMLLPYTNYKAKKNVFYAKMIQQWVPTFLALFVVIIVARYIACYIYFPSIFAKTTPFVGYSVLCFVGLILLGIAYYFTKKNMQLSTVFFLFILLATSSSEMFLSIVFAEMFYNGFVPYPALLQPSMLFFLSRVVPYALVFASLLCTLITIARRNKDTFGRDYYIFTLQYSTNITSIVSLILSLLSMFSAVWITTLISANFSFSWLFAVVFFIPSFLSLTVFFILKRIQISDSNPLQFKISYAIALILSVIALCIDIISYQPYIL